MQYHTSFLNKLIEDNSFTSYLELGLGNGSNFNSIQCEGKFGVDINTPFEGKNIFKGTTDEYFEQLDGRTKYHAIFIDSDHNHKQLERDIINSMKHLKKGGLIIVHDILPHNEDMQKVPRQQREWTGDCWRCWVGLKDKYHELGAYAIKDDYGIGVIPYNKEVKIEQGFSSQMLYKQFEEVKDMYFEA